MKQKISIWALLRMVLSLILAIGMQSFLQPCIHEDGNFGSCHNAGTALTGIGVILVLLSLAGILIRKQQIQKILVILSGLLSLLAVFVPGGIIPLCMMNTMRCNLIMRPAALVLSVLILVLSVAEGIGLRYHTGNTHWTTGRKEH